ncbi:MAG: hypothetical protein GWO24_08180, partial [Akkermansiaceae bacterium]|nr:hypothetical protein [Akkermansiaceae bacterium]
MPGHPPAYLPGAAGEALDVSQRTRTIVQTRGDSLEVLDSSARGFTISFWLRPNSTTGNSVLFGFQTLATQRRFEAVWTTTGGSAGKIAYHLPVPGAGVVTFESSDFGAGLIEEDRWNHFVLTYDRATGTLTSHVNGAEARREGQPGIVLGSNELLRVMLPRRTVDAELATPLALDSFGAFDGALDELAFFDRPLTLAEVSVLAVSSSGLCLPTANRPPFVEAGDPINLDPSLLTTPLAGFVTDDNPDLLISWNVLAGPGDVTFSDPADPATTAAFSTPGHYTLQLSAFDGFETVSDVLPVRAALPCTAAPGRLLAWFPGNFHSHDLVSFRRGSWGSNRPSYASGIVGDAFAFDGVGGFLAFDPPTTGFPGGADFTFEGWLRIDQPAAGGSIVAFRQPGSLADRGGIELVDSTLRFRVFQPGGFFNAFAIPGSLPAGPFFHFAFTVSPFFGHRIYLDGDLVHSGSFHGGWLNPWVNNTYLGGYPGGVNNFQGALDEFAIYDRALTASEIGSIVDQG